MWGILSYRGSLQGKWNGVGGDSLLYSVLFHESAIIDGKANYGLSDET